MGKKRERIPEKKKWEIFEGIFMAKMDAFPMKLASYADGADGDVLFLSLFFFQVFIFFSHFAGRLTGFCAGNSRWQYPRPWDPLGGGVYSEYRNPEKREFSVQLRNWQKRADLFRGLKYFFSRADVGYPFLFLSTFPGHNREQVGLHLKQRLRPPTSPLYPVSRKKEPPYTVPSPHRRIY